MSEGNSDYYLSNQKDLDSYQIFDNDNHIEIRWHFKAKNESRSFSLKYIIYDVVGRLVDIIDLGILTSDNYNIIWSPRNIPSGTYLITMSNSQNTYKTKVTFIK